MSSGGPLAGGSPVTAMLNVAWLDPPADVATTVTLCDPISSKVSDKASVMTPVVSFMVKRPSAESERL